MGSRAFGALFALAAAAAFVISIATSAWWAGHPTIDGHVTTAKDVHIGLLGGEGCNTGGDGHCEPIEIDDTLTLADYGELGVTGLATLLALITAIAALKISDNRKGLATATLLTTLLAAAGAGAVLMLGPGIKASQTVEVPLGWGLYVFGGGVGAALLAALITRKIEPEPLRLKPSNAPLLQPPPLDVRQMLQGQHDGVRPSALGPEPMLGAPGNMPGEPSPRDSMPLFEAAPQLRPLYDPMNAGVAPAPLPPSAIPMRAPTPMPRDQIDLLTGKLTPPPLSERKPEPRAKPPSAAPPSAIPRTNPPNARTNSPSSPPPSIPKTQPPRARPASGAPPATASSSSSRLKPPSAAPPVADPAAGGPKQPRAKTLPAGSDPGVKKPILPAAPKVPMPAQRPSQPTMTHAVPPMPTADNQPPPAVLPAKRAVTDDDERIETSMMPAQRAPTENDDRLAAGLRETDHITAVEIDHEAKARAQHAKASQARVPTDARTGQRSAAPVGDVTETGVEIAPAPSIITGEERALSTAQREVARAPTDDPFENVRALSMETPIHGAPVSETLPAQRISALFPSEDVPDEGSRPAEDLMSTIEQNPKTPVPTIVAREQQSAERPATQVPMSTAPTSLPPPKNVNVETMPSGPTPACPQCESPMAWVEEHLRFYCKSCRMYF
ncbi:MAG TPA: hypothetical protein VLB44_16165 [Kofleriaceae bacterium]|nr:hypothetical protein [Kofleriaceae bacterium]